MNILFILKVIASMATIATGLLALVRPAAVPGFTGLKYDGPRGICQFAPFLEAFSLRWAQHLFCWVNPLL